MHDRMPAAARDQRVGAEVAALAVGQRGDVDQERHDVERGPRVGADQPGELGERDRAVRPGDAGVRQGVLQAQARTALLRGGNIAPFALAATGVLHGVALVENDHSVEVGAQPFNDLPDAGKLLAAVVGPQRSVG